MESGEFPRITLEEVLRAYHETGVEPVRKHMFHERTHACGVGALVLFEERVGSLIFEGEDLSPGSLLTIQVITRYGGEYIQGFMAGFDGYSLSPGKRRELRSIQGHEDGRRIAEALFEGSALEDYARRRREEEIEASREILLSEIYEELEKEEAYV